MEFTLPAAPGGESLVSAELQIRTTTGTTAGTLAVHNISLTGLFDPATITWNTKPANISLLATLSEATVDTPYSILLDRNTIAPLAGTTIGIAIDTVGTDNLTFWSGTFTTVAFRPVLVLTYATSAVVSIMDFTSDPAVVDTLTTDLPTVTATAQTTSTIAGAASIIPWTDSKFTFRSGIPVVGAVFPDNLLGNYTTRYPNSWGSPPNVCHSISITGTTVEFQFKMAAASPSATLWIHVDGKKTTAKPVQAGFTNGGRFVYKLVFATSATRIISVDCSYLPLQGVYTNTADTVVNAAPAAEPVIVIQGDSISGGSGQNTGVINGTWPKRFGDYVKKINIWNQGIGGTGYLATNAGASVTMRARNADISSYSPKVCILWAGYNDKSSTQSALQTEADLLYTAVKAVSGLTEIYIIGCWSPLFFPTTAEQNIDGWLRARAAAASLPFVSPITGNCYDKFGAQIGFVGPIIDSSANQALWVGADNVHPTDAGHARIAQWMYAAIKILATDTSSSLAAPSISASQTVRSQQLVSITAAIAGTATAWNITQTAGPTQTISNLGNGTFNLRASAIYSGTNTTCTFSVTATTASGTTAAATTNVIIRPHKFWQRGVGGSVPQIAKSFGINVDSPPPISATPWLAFDMPSRASLEAITTYRTGTHAMMNYTVAVNNTATSEATDYWSTHWWVGTGNTPPSAASAIFSAPGTNIIAESRDRYIFRPPRPTPYQIKDHKDILRWLKDSAFDFCSPHSPSFAGLTGSFEAQQLVYYLQAAAALGGIKIVPWVDGSSAVLDNMTTTVSGALALMNDATLGPAFMTVSGRKLFICYSPEATAAGATGVSRWRAFKTGLTQSAVAPYFWSSWQGSDWPGRATTLYPGASETYDQIFDAHSNFGQRDPNSTNSTSIEASGAAAHCASVFGKQWMTPCAVQAVVPRGNPTGTLNHGWMWEALGFGQVIAAATVAINNNSNYLCWNTLNDFPEGSMIGVSKNNLYNWLDIISYYNVWFKTRVAPTILRTVAYVANRKHMLLAPNRPTFTSTQDKFEQRESGTALADVVDVLVFAAQTVDIAVTVGGITTNFTSQAAGVVRCTVTARPGSVSAVVKVAGSGTVLTSVTSRFPILTSTNVEDAAYYVTGSHEGHPGRPALYID